MVCIEFQETGEVAYDIIHKILLNKKLYLIFSTIVLYKFYVWCFCSVVSIEIMEIGEGAYDILHNEIHLEKKVIIFFNIGSILTFWIHNYFSCYFLQCVMYKIPGP